MSDKQGLNQNEEMQRYEEDELVMMSGGNKRESRPPRRLEMTSLVDILTVLLVFLIRNVSVEAQKVMIPDDIALPTSITFNETEDNEGIVVMRVSQNQIHVGDVPAGSPRDFLTSQKAFDDLLDLARSERRAIARRDGVEPVLVLQADRNIRCQVISRVIHMIADADFSGVYFSTVRGDDPQQVFGME